MRHPLLLATAAGLLLAPPAAAQPAPVADVVVNMRGVEIADVAEQISRITGRTLVLDPAVKGVVTVTSAEPLSPDGAWDLFQSVLRVHGFAAVRSGRAWRIIPQANAIRDTTAGGRGSGQEVGTRLLRLRNAPSDAVARVLRPLVASFGSVEALTNPNAVAVTDYADNLRRIEGIVRSLDGGGGAAIESIPLRYASAREAAAAIQAVLGDPAQAGGARVAADERSNTLLLRGEPNALAEARRILRTIDRPGGATPVTRLFRLANGDAEAVTEVIRGVLGQQTGTANPVARSLASTRNAFGTRPVGSTTNGAIGIGSGVASGLAGIGGDAAAALAAAQGTGGIAAVGGAGGSTTPAAVSTPDLTIQPAPELNAIVVRGTPAAVAAIEPLIADLDVRRPQVLIEAAIVEITGENAEALGIQLGLGAAAINAGSGGATSFGLLGLPLRSILATLGVPAAGATLSEGVSGNIRVSNDFSILVQALGSSTRANLLSTPSLTTLDNEAAEIVVGQNVPFRTGSYATDGNTTTPFTTIERQDVGITLRVIPRVHQGNVVRLEVAQEVSSLVGAVTGAADLITNRRSIQTTVLADDGQTIVLGGLITDDRQQVRSQVPVLGSIPVLGEAFKARRESQTKRTLFVFLKPTILRDQAAATTVTTGKYARLRGEEAALQDRGSLLLNPPGPRLTMEIEGVY